MGRKTGMDELESKVYHTSKDNQWNRTEADEIKFVNILDLIDEDDDRTLFPPRAVSEITEVRETRLRSWRRNKILTPAYKSKSGFLYTKFDILLVDIYRSIVEGGRSVHYLKRVRSHVRRGFPILSPDEYGLRPHSWKASELYIRNSRKSGLWIVDLNSFD